MAATTNRSENTEAVASKFLYSLGPHEFHRIHYTEWGDPGNPRVIIGVHALTRNCRDFDDLAKALCETHRVVCPDMPGRGLSDWLACKEDYTITTYLNDIAVLIGRLQVDEVGWVGTSMGGLIGMHLAGRPGSPIKRMILNDIGPEFCAAGLERFVGYVGKNSSFPSLRHAEMHFRKIHAPFGPLSNEQWTRLTRNSTRLDPDGNYRMHYDPGIAEAFQSFKSSPASLWDVWDRIRCPVHIFRGCESDLLTAQTVQSMLKRGPKSRLTEFPGIGHAPSLMSKDQIDIVEEWFSE
ncbi:MAG: alpha/beta fold hydrolase [Methylococcales bacterium]